jgi:hypothetical protein
MGLVGVYYYDRELPKHAIVVVVHAHVASVVLLDEAAEEDDWALSIQVQILVLQHAVSSYVPINDIGVVGQEECLPLEPPEVRGDTPTLKVDQKLGRHERPRPLEFSAYGFGGLAHQFDEVVAVEVRGVYPVYDTVVAVAVLIDSQHQIIGREHQHPLDLKYLEFGITRAFLELMELEQDGGLPTQSLNFLDRAWAPRLHANDVEVWGAHPLQTSFFASEYIT